MTHGVLIILVLRLSGAVPIVRQKRASGVFRASKQHSLPAALPTRTCETNKRHASESTCAGTCSSR